MVLLGDVRELEEERERAQHERLLLERKLGDMAGELSRGGRISRAPGPCVLPDLLDELEQPVALLLHEGLAQDVPEQAHICAQR